ncbi:hypothetical protein Hanom_Chr06g00539761 [Helianthus anomalus]
MSHWLVVVDKPEGEPTRDEIIESYINTLAKVVGRNYISESIIQDYICIESPIAKPLSLKKKKNILQSPVVRAIGDFDKDSLIDILPPP